MKVTVTDVRLEHPVLGGYSIQIQLTREDGNTIGYAWPLKLGQSAKDFAMELHYFGDRLRREYGEDK